MSDITIAPSTKLHHGDKVKVKQTGQIGTIQQIRPAMQLGDKLFPESVVVRFGPSSGNFSAWLPIDELVEVPA